MRIGQNEWPIQAVGTGLYEMGNRRKSRVVMDK